MYLAANHYFGTRGVHNINLILLHNNRMCPSPRGGISGHMKMNNVNTQLNYVPVGSEGTWLDGFTNIMDKGDS